MAFGTLDRLLAIDTPSTTTTTVPACPDLTVGDLVAHLLSLPAAIGAGDLPTGDVDEWIVTILRARGDRSIDELAAEWASVDDTITAMIEGSGAMLFDDIVIHEYDLRGALGTVERELVAHELSVPRALETCRAELEARGLGAIEVRSGDMTWKSHDGPIRVTITATPWETFRLLSSRRTADEIAEVADGPELPQVIELLDAHLTLPAIPLGER